MDWKQRCLERLREHVDDNGDLAPPWSRFPTYERGSLGWRMGAGEGWLDMWHVFLEQLDTAFEVRLAYLRRHPAAPINWASSVYEVLYPSSYEANDDADDDADDDDDDDAADAAAAAEAAARRATLLQMGLIASDAAYSTWLRQQDGVRWPWTYAETPEDAARYWTRDMSFWSRQVAELRGRAEWVMPAVPDAWQSCAAPLATGEAGPLDLERGLLSLARVLAAGHVTPPWEMGLTPGDFADSSDDEMSYLDAFGLWGQSAFDDRAHLRRYLDATRIPPDWEGWVAEQWPVD